MRISGLLIEALEWDDDNEAHVGRHLDPELAVEMIESGDWIQVRNKT